MTAFWENLSYEVAHAVGMVSAQARCPVIEALDLMKARACVEHQTLDEVAEAVLNRTIRFTEIV